MLYPAAQARFWRILRYARLRQPDDPDDGARVVAGEHDAGRFDRDVGARADGEADVGAGERRVRR